MTLTDISADLVLRYLDTLTDEDAVAISARCPLQQQCLADLARRHHEPPTAPIDISPGRRTLGH